MAFVVCFSPDAYVTIWLILLYFLLDACAAICLVVLFIFRLTSMRLYGLLCYLSSPDALVAIWHVFFVFTWRLRGYIASIVCFHLTPPRLYDTCYVFILFVLAWRPRGHMAHVVCFCLMPLRRYGLSCFIFYLIPPRLYGLSCVFVWRPKGYVVFVVSVLA